MYVIQLGQMRNNWHGLLLLDGPGVLSEDITGQTKTSTFQCIIFALGTRNSTSSGMQIIYSSTQILQQNKMYVGAQKTPFEFLSHKEKTITVLDLQAQQNLQICVTITNLAFWGLSSFECRYGGIVAGKILGEYYAESQSICQTVEGEMERHFYSHNSSMILLVYWYENYSALNISIKLSVTKCNPVLLHANCYDMHCARNVSSKKCVSFLTKITKYSGVHFQYDFSLAGLVYSLADNSCVVVQIVRNQFVIHTGLKFRANRLQYNVFNIIRMAPKEISLHGK